MYSDQLKGSQVRRFENRGYGPRSAENGGRRFEREDDEWAPSLRLSGYRAHQESRGDSSSRTEEYGSDAPSRRTDRRVDQQPRNPGHVYKSRWDDRQPMDNQSQKRLRAWSPSPNGEARGAPPAGLDSTRDDQPDRHSESSGHHEKHARVEKSHPLVDRTAKLARHHKTDDSDVHPEKAIQHEYPRQRHRHHSDAHPLINSDSDQRIASDSRPLDGFGDIDKHGEVKSGVESDLRGRSRSRKELSTRSSSSSSSPSSEEESEVDNAISRSSKRSRRRHLRSLSRSRSRSPSHSKHRDERSSSRRKHSSRRKDKDQVKRKSRDRSESTEREKKKRKKRDHDRKKDKNKEERRSILTGKKIKLKVKKDKADHERDANRKDLLQFLNSTFE